MPCRLYSKRVVVGTLACVVVWGTVQHEHHLHTPDPTFGHPPVMPTSISSNMGGTATWGGSPWGGRRTWG